MTRETKDELGLEFSGETQARMEFMSKSDKVFDLAAKRATSGLSSKDSVGAEGKGAQDQEAIPTEMKIHVRSNEEGEQEDYEDPVNVVTRPTTVGSGSGNNSIRAQSALKEEDETEEAAEEGEDSKVDDPN